MADERPGGYCEALLARVGGDQQLFGELCHIFLDDAPKRLAQIRAGLRADDASVVRAAAHAFKGAASVFDAEAVVTAARRLEQMGRDGDLRDADAVCLELEQRSQALFEEVRAAFQDKEVTSWKS